MNSTPIPFQTASLMSSVFEAISSHSELPEAQFDIHINELVPDVIIGDRERIQRALIIILERALIQFPGTPIRITCALVRCSTDQATVSFSITQDLTPEQRSRALYACQSAVMANPSGEHSEGMSIRIAERVIAECGGRLVKRSQDYSEGDVCFWVPVGLTTSDLSNSTAFPHEKPTPSIN